LNKRLIAILKIQIATNIKFGGSTTRSHHTLEIQRYNIHVHVLEIWEQYYTKHLDPGDMFHTVTTFISTKGFF